MTRIDAIESRLAAATPGPWIYEPSEALHGIPDSQTHYVTDQVSIADDDPPLCSLHSKADAELIAHAPDDLKFLLAERQRLLCRVAYLEGWKENAEEAHRG